MRLSRTVQITEVALGGGGVVVVGETEMYKVAAMSLEMVTANKCAGRVAEERDGS